MIEGVSINTKLSFRIDPQKISINLCEKNDYVFDVVENKASRVTPLVEYSVDDGDSRSKGYSAKDIQAAAAKTTLSGSAKASLLNLNLCYLDLSGGLCSGSVRCAATRQQWTKLW
ncbi:unnamed protein product [Acanthoscelides obtectus]|uniref:Uncharacterized protein n=1 Tax=Acanthoscelides obtectus TaxID=200917 RepID=A0A9P0Q3F1_ACAOB|nr:unnamed protein product [Acanthoscelides obtectus]CAK1669087.1 hypothetical protein AOBTE_LOCUS26789 [Acanthoscelides obtectus]